MADCAHSAPGTSASTGNKSKLSTTRRGMLTAAGATAVASVIGGPALAGPAERPWDRLRREFEAARATVERYENATYLPAMQDFNRQGGEAPPFISDGPGRVAYELHCMRVERLWETTGFTAISDHMRALDDAEWRARQLMMAEPAPDAAALAFKVKLAFADAEIWENEGQAIRRDAAKFGV